MNANPGSSPAFVRLRHVRARSNIKKQLAAVLFLSFSLQPAVPVNQKAARNRAALVFTHVTVIDATGAPPKPDMTVVITRDRITALRRTGQIRIPVGAQVIEAGGKFLIPGLWDMHTHFTADEKNLLLFLSNGVTGVRDMGSIVIEPGGLMALLMRAAKLSWPPSCAQGKASHIVICSAHALSLQV
jgi:hypothetical protein